jgi:phosphopantetheinyl transferase (holo-ACP synthase)
MPAAGIAGLIKAALAVHHGVLPPTLHCEDPHPDLGGSRFSMPATARDWDGPRRAGVNAFGFGGINAHVVLEQAPGPWIRARAAVREPAERMLLLAAPTVDALLRQLDDGGALTRDDAVAAPDGGPCRLAIVGPDERRIALARRIAAQGKPWRGRNDVYFTAAPLLGPHAATPAGQPVGTPGRIAFVFPGLEETFTPRITDVTRHFGLPEPHLDGATGGAIGEFGLGVVTVARVLTTALRRMAVRPDVMAGHSVGEWSAMIAAEMYPPADVEHFLAEFDPSSVEVPGVVFGALGCGADQARKAIGGLPDIVVSHDNCPHQSIVCGEEASVRTALDRLASSGIGGRVLPFRSGFHTPMLGPYLGGIRRNFERLRVQRPAVPVWSATTVEPYPDDPAAIRELVIRHLVEPVRFRELVQRLYGEGVRVFVGVGTGSVTSFAEDTLHGLDALAIPANVPKREGMAQLRRLGAALWAEGGSPRLGALAAPSPAAGAHHNAGPPLSLGTPFVHVAGTIAPLSVPRESPKPVADPVLAELNALVSEAAAAAEAVTAAWANPPQPRPATETATETVSVVRELSADTMPYLTDHCFYRQRDGWPDLADRFPVVPMTTLLEIMATAALDRFPGRRIAGFRDVRALRWLAVAPPATVTIRTTPDEHGNAAVVIEGYSRGTVLLAESYPAAPAPDPVPIADPRPVGFDAHTLYADRWMFHGPEFQGICALGEAGSDGITGTIRTPAAPGALLDNAGQLMGLWIMLRLDRDQLAFPSAVCELRFSGPHPRAGEELACLVKIREVTGTAVTADVELRRATGEVWARIEGWTDRRFTADERTWPVFRHANLHLAGEPQPGGWLLARERWPDPATRELIMRRYLTTAERERYAAIGPRGQRQWLLGRVAVKDAVRTALLAAGGGPIYPAELTVGNDAEGRPFVRGPFAAPIAVSLAHSGPFGAALTGASPGIDVERVEHRGTAFEETALSPAERDLLTALGGSRDEWLTRFWTAKEAAAKSAGTGLGDPRAFTAEPSGENLLTVRYGSRTWLVHTRTGLTAPGSGGRPADHYVVAWTSAEATPAALVSAHRTERATT